MAFIRTSKAKAAKNRRKAVRYRQVCRAVDARDGMACRVCGRLCVTNGHHHHLVFRSRGGQDTAANVILICASCHDDIHAHRLTVTGNGNGGLHIERIA